MEPVIAVLPPHVIDQIAAGEVIERPASVVKELVDNAIDAGASTITVEVAAGGRALVRVTDDGCGMTARDAVLAFERHATSKLRVVDDLWGISSMGFRGEALPSIASVARVALTTRRASDLAATRVVIEGSKLISAAEVGAPVGTTVEVVDLLYNVPARLKFLKGEATEASHITDLIAKVALSHPQLHLRLRHRAAGSVRTALELPPDRDGFSRVKAVLGARIASRMVPITGEEGGVKISAFLGAPELAQATARGVQIFVGKRAVRDRGVLHALAMGYGELIPRGRYPVAVILLELAAGAVDFNVHPQKSEVRFADPTAVAAAVRHVVQAGVAAAAWRDDAVAPIQMTAIASSAPPALPFDGPATALAQRYAKELRQRASIGSIGGIGNRNQGSLGLDRHGHQRQWAADIRKTSTAERAVDGRALAAYTRSLRALEKGTSSAAEGANASVADDAALAAAHRVVMASDAAGLFANGDDAAIAAAYRAALPAIVEGDDAAIAAAYRAALAIVGPSGASGDDAAIAAAYRDALPRDRDDAYRAALVAATASHGDDPLAAMYRAALAAGPHAGVAMADSRGGAVAAGPDPSQSFHPSIAGLDPTAPIDRVDPMVLEEPAQLAKGSGPVAEAGHGYFSQLRYLGQLDLTYLVCESMGELVLIDQHAAHERVELARLLAQQDERGPSVQKLLFPVTIDATASQLELVGRVGEVLAAVGYEVEPFGKSTLAIKAVPSGIRHGDPTQLLRRLLDEWARDGAPSDDERLTRVLAEIACHSVVRAGDRLAAGEAEALLRSLDGVDPATPAPHGRSLLLRLPLAEIGRRFGR